METSASLAHRQHAVAVVAAPVLLLASTAAYIISGDGMNNGELGGALQVWAMIFFAVGAVTLTRRFGDVAPRASALLLLVGLAGAGGGVAYGIDSIQAAVFDNPSIQDADSKVAPLALQIPGLLFPLGLVGTGVMLARTATAPVWAGILLVIGAALFPIARIPDIEALAVVGDALLVLALIAIGWHALGDRTSTGLRTGGVRTATN